MLEKCNSPDELNEREKFWIAYFDCRRPHGFNVLEGGEIFREQNNRRRVICIDTGFEYESITEAARQTGVSVSCIADVCNGKQGVTRGLYFRFVDVPLEEQKQFVCKPDIRRRVLCVETGIEYDSGTEAARQTGLPVSKISEVCSNKRKTVGGLNFVFANTPREEWQLNVSPKRRVLCIETGVEYESISEAARQLNIHQASIGNVCRGKYGSAGGLHFRFVDVPLEEQKQFVYKPDIRRRVLCIETGIEHDSIREAARQTGRCSKKISEICNGKRKSTGGLHFKFA